jgi:putative sterol carrier protein
MMAETVEQFFTTLPNKLSARKTAGMNATYQFIITGDQGGNWYVEIKDGQPGVVRGDAEMPDITITAPSDVWLQVVNGEMSGQSAFLTGQVKLQGDITLALKLQSLL